MASDELKLMGPNQWSGKTRDIYERDFTSRDCPNDLVKGKILSEGLKAKDGILKPDQGYVVAFRYQNDDAGFYTYMGEEIANSLPKAEGGKSPVIRYHEPTLHTTLIWSPMSNEDFDDRDGLLNKLTEGLHFVKDELYAPKLKSGGLLYNQGTVVAGNLPEGKAMHGTINTALNSWYNLGLRRKEIKQPWGAHSTIIRMAKNFSPGELGDFIAKIEGPIGILGEISMPKLDVLTYTFDPTLDGFEKPRTVFEIYSRFKLKSA